LGIYNLGPGSGPVPILNQIPIPVPKEDSQVPIGFLLSETKTDNSNRRRMFLLLLITCNELYNQIPLISNSTYRSTFTNSTTNCGIII
jgi:hypothetical protein